MQRHRRILDARGLPTGRFRADQVERLERPRLKAKIGEFGLARQIRRAEALRGRER